MYERSIPSILGAYGVNYREILPVQKGYRNEVYPIRLVGGRMIQLTVFKREADSLARIKRTDLVQQHAARRGLPTRRRYDSRLMILRSGEYVVYAGLFDYLSGETIPWEAYTRTHLKLLGGALGRLHRALADCPTTSLPNIIDESLALLGRMTQYVSDEQVCRAARDKLGVELAVPTVCARVLSTCRSLPGQALHMDFVRGNILFRPALEGDALQESGVALSGILDFEKTAVGHPIFDVARTYAFLLVDTKYKQPEEILASFLRSGYAKRGGMTTSLDPTLLYVLVNFYLLHDLYKFLRHNPYESLHKNEHFMRTTDMLVKRNVIRYI